jgi:hypothetical protein
LHALRLLCGPSRFLILAFTAKYAKEAAKIAEKKRQPYKLHHYKRKKDRSLFKQNSHEM